jgi:hypothetical protein
VGRQDFRHQLHLAAGVNKCWFFSGDGHAGSRKCRSDASLAYAFFNQRCWTVPLGLVTLTIAIYAAAVLITLRCAVARGERIPEAMGS